MTPRERIEMKELQPLRQAILRKLNLNPNALRGWDDEIRIIKDPNASLADVKYAVNMLSIMLEVGAQRNPKTKARSRIPGKFAFEDAIANEKATEGRARPKSQNVWKDVNDWRDTTDYRAVEPDRNIGGADRAYIQIMIPKRKGHEVMDDIGRIEQEIGALSHHIEYVEGSITGETGAAWAVSFVVRWDFHFTDSGSERFCKNLITNIENNISGIGEIKLI